MELLTDCNITALHITQSTPNEYRTKVYIRCMTTAFMQTYTMQLVNLFVYVKALIYVGEFEQQFTDTKGPTVQYLKRMKKEFDLTYLMNLIVYFLLLLIRVYILYSELLISTSSYYLNNSAFISTYRYAYYNVN